MTRAKAKENMVANASCKRCGRLVATAVRSLLGLDHVKARWGVICQGCITPEEERQMLLEQGEGIAVRSSLGVGAGYNDLKSAVAKARGG